MSDYRAGGARKSSDGLAGTWRGLRAYTEQLMDQDVRYERRQMLDAVELDGLFVAAWGSPKPGYAQVLERSFTWVTARVGDQLVGFVNVAWDGGSHFFLLDTTVHPDWRGNGIARRLV